ncbi:hypothetical protein ACFSQ7_00610 [Paenibacillus rhizoplanae]
MTQFFYWRSRTICCRCPLFAERYGAAKSSVSEDLAIIKEVFEGEGMGELQTLAGAAGGVRYIPRMPMDMALAFVNRLCGQLEQSDRIFARRLSVHVRSARPSVPDGTGRQDHCHRLLRGGD